MKLLPLFLAASRFPKPDFESDYAIPSTTAPFPEGAGIEYLDTVMLALALVLASYIVLTQRSRKMTFLLMISSLVYFGFWRKGCICPVGSIQNIALALFENTYAIPFTVLAFFLLPILFTLFFGRTFCAAVCPLGAIQDIVVAKPIKLPIAVTHTLTIIPYIYLGAAVLMAATGSAFIICRIDPFVAFFRLSGELPMLAFGAALLLIGVFIARPYCRFICPYGVLLNWASRFSKFHMTITPGDCIQCKLCEDACPFDYIRKPVPTVSPETREKGINRLKTLLLLLPILIAVSGWTCSKLYIPLSRLNTTVILAEQIAVEENGSSTQTTLRSDAFRESGQSIPDLYKDALDIRIKIKGGCWLLGIFIGMVIGFKLIAFSIRRTRTDYEPDRGECLSCGRCFSTCPVKPEEVGGQKAEDAGESKQGPKKRPTPPYRHPSKEGKVEGRGNEK